MEDQRLQQTGLQIASQSRQTAMDLSAISMWWVVLPQRLMSMRTGCPEATPAWPLETIREAPRRGVASPTAAGGHSMVRGCRLDSGDWRARFQGSPGDSAPPTERRLRPCRNTNLPPLQRLCERHLLREDKSTRAMTRHLLRVSAMTMTGQATIDTL